MTRSWEERTDADRERDLTARSLARRASISRSPRRRSWWQYALAGLLVATALIVGALALLDAASLLVSALCVLLAVAMLTN